jgi:hypothetical protein
LAEGHAWAESGTKPRRIKSFHSDEIKKSSFTYEQTGANSGAFLNVTRDSDGQMIHVCRFDRAERIGDEPYLFYRSDITHGSAPQWMQDAQTAKTLFIAMPASGFGKVKFLIDGREVPEGDVTPAGLIMSQPLSFPTKSLPN